MARQESDREDLMREATALVERAELVVSGFDDPIVVGFRRDGSGSIFFGADPVYQFNSRFELRRAFIQGLLIKAVGGSLASLRRDREQSAAVMLRHDFNEEETRQFLFGLEQWIHKLRASLENQEYQVTGAVPDNKVVDRITNWIASLDSPIRIAQQPNAG